MAVEDGTSSSVIAAAARRLADGELVALPTETVYGLGARADDDAAVRRIFEAKGRPADHPLIVHVLDEATARGFAAHWPEHARRLAQAFWPGPVTVIVPRRPGRAGAAAGGQPSIGLRCPAHPVARALLAEAGRLGVPGIAAPSANRFGRISPTRAAHVREEFGEALTVLDGGDCEAGIESAIVDCTGARPALLRPGTVSRAALEAALGVPLAAPGADGPRAPGTLEAHYAPRARLRLMEPALLETALDVLPKSPVNPLAVYFRTIAPPRGVRAARPMPEDPAAAAHELFADLRELDATGVSIIWVEAPPDTPAWEGVRDRLRRAAAA